VHQILAWMSLEDAKVPVPGRMPPPNEVVVNDTLNLMLGGVMSRIKRFLTFAQVIKGAIVHDAPPFTVQDSTQPDAEMGLRNSTVFHTHVFSEAETGQFIAACKRNQATVTAATTACFLESEAHVMSKELKAPFQLCVASVTNARNHLIPRLSEDYMSPLLGSTGAFYTGKIYGDGKDGNLLRAIQVAKCLGANLREETQTERLLLRSSLLPWELSNQPTATNAPSLVVSSWSAKGPINKKYNGLTVEQALFCMNVCVNGWPTLAIYTIAGKLHVTIITPTPRFSSCRLSFSREEWILCTD